MIENPLKDLCLLLNCYKNPYKIDQTEAQYGSIHEVNHKQLKLIWIHSIMKNKLLLNWLKFILCWGMYITDVINPEVIHNSIKIVVKNKCKLHQHKWQATMLPYHIIKVGRSYKNWLLNFWTRSSSNGGMWQPIINMIIPLQLHALCCNYMWAIFNTDLRTSFL